MMKKLFLSIISLVLAGGAYAQLNTFSDGDTISAEKMNQNFQALVNSNLVRKTSIDCDAGETINGAIGQGFNDITISGTCNENLYFLEWDYSAKTNVDPLIPPRYLKITGKCHIFTKIEISPI